MPNEVEINWSNFKPHTLGALRSFRNEGYLTDVTLVSDDRKLFPAHKLILTTASDYFEKLFRQNTSFYQTFICLEKVSNSELSDIIDFIYLGQVTIQNVKISRFLELAKRFSLKGLNNEDNDSSKKIKEEFIDEDRTGTNTDEHGREDNLYINGAEAMKGQSIIDNYSSNFINGKEFNTSNIEGSQDELDAMDVIDEQKIMSKVILDDTEIDSSNEDKDLSESISLQEETNVLAENHKKLKRGRKSDDSLMYSNNKNLLIYIKNERVTMEKVDEVLSHFYTKTGKSYSCMRCTHVARAPAHMKEHVEKYLKDLRFVCSECGLTFKGRARNRAHIYSGQCLRVQNGEETITPRKEYPSMEKPKEVS